MDLNLYHKNPRFAHDKKIAENDAFNALWQNNYDTNFANREFDKVNRFPLSAVASKTRILNKKIPYFLVNPGPSLEKNIHILERVHKEKKGYIIASDVCMFRLLDAGIVPDVVCSIDPSSNIARFWKEYAALTKEIILFAPVTCAPASIQLWQGPIVFFNTRDVNTWRDLFFLKMQKRTNKFGSLLNLFFVGATVTQTAHVLNACKIILVGWDFSADENENFYCKNFLEKRVYTTITKEAILNDVFFNEECFANIRNTCKSSFDDARNLYLTYLKEQEVIKYKEIKIKNLWTTKQFQLYYKTFLNNITPALVCPIVNCTEGGILTELPTNTLAKEIDLLETINIEKFRLLT